MRTMYRLEGLLVRGERLIVGLAMVVLLAAGLFQVIVRLLGVRSLGTDEIASLAMVTLIFVGAAMITATKDAIAVEVAEFIPSAIMRRVLGLVVHCVTILFGVTFTYFAWELALVAIGTGEQSLQLGIPKAIPTTLMAVGGALLTLHAILRLIADIVPGSSVEEPAHDGGPTTTKVV